MCFVECGKEVADGPLATIRLRVRSPRMAGTARYGRWQRLEGARGGFFGSDWGAEGAR
jgi:hypothetical protein